MTELNKNFTTRKAVSELEQIPLVHEWNGQVVTNSLIVAEAFGVEHKNVIRAIKSLIAQNNGREDIFMKGVYKDENCREHPVYYVSQVGFTFLAMGFPSKRTAWFEPKFIEQFHRARSDINGRGEDYEKPFYLKLAYLAAIIG